MFGMACEVGEVIWGGMEMKKDRPEDVRMQREIERRTLRSLLVSNLSILLIPFSRIDKSAKSMEKEAEVLKRFKKWTRVRNDEERKVLRRYAFTGMVVFRYNSHAHHTEAKLTDQGKWFAKTADWSR